MEQQIYDSTGLIIGSIEKQACAEQERLQELSEKLYSEKAAALENEIRSKYESLVSYELEKQRVAVNKRASALEAENKAALAVLRRKVTDEVFRTAQNRIEEFVASDAYAPFLVQSTLAVSKLYEGAAEIRLRKEDAPLKQSLAETFGKPVSFAYDESIRLGGIKVHFKNAAVLVDDTLDARLETAKEEFIKNSGLGFKR